MNPYLSFIALVECDQLRDTHMKQMNALLAQRMHSEKELSDKKSELDAERVRVRVLRKQIDEKELELKIAAARERDKVVQLDHVASPREYTSLSHEIENLIAQQKRLEDEILQLLNAYEFEENLVHNKADVLVVHEMETEKKCSLLDEQCKMHEQEYVQLEAQRALLMQQVQPDLLIKYEHMRTQIANPVVPVKNNVCSGCFYEVRPHDIVDLRHHKLVQCKECYRLLYSV